MNSVNIDLHGSRSHVAVIDEHGELSLSRRIANDPDSLLELLGGLEGETQIALEATYGWELLAELLEDSGYEYHLAHPLRTKRPQPRVVGHLGAPRPGTPPLRACACSGELPPMSGLHQPDGRPLD